MLRKAREHRGLTQAQFAAKMNVTQGAVHQWENAPTAITIDRLIRICEGLEFVLDLNMTPVERLK